MIALRQLLADFVFPEGAERRNRAEREANTDALTGLANLRALNKALPNIESDSGLLFIFADGNDFGLVNKLVNREAGDHIIKCMAKALSAHTSRVFRCGGDEFIAVIPHVRAEATRMAMEQTFGVVAHLAIRITISCGLGHTVEEAEADMKRRKAAQKSIWKNAEKACILGGTWRANGIQSS